MNHVLIKKIIELFIEILKKIKVKKRSMGNEEQNNQQSVTISSNTQIIFTLKSYLATISSILGLFVSFYFLIIVPRIDQTESYQKSLYEQQEKFMTEKFSEQKQTIEDNTKAIGLNTQAIKANNDRFRDLNQSVENINSSGSFGRVVSHNIDMDTANFAINHQ